MFVVVSLSQNWFLQFIYIVSSCFVLLSLHAYYGIPVCCVSFLFLVLVVVFFYHSPFR